MLEFKGKKIMVCRNLMNEQCARVLVSVGLWYSSRPVRDGCPALY